MAFIKLEPEWVTLPSDKAAAAANKAHVSPEYLIGPLSLSEREVVLNLMSVGPNPEDIHRAPWGSITAMQVKGGLRGWRNLPVEFKPTKEGKASEEQLAMLDHRTFQEIAREAWARSTISEANRGN